MSKNDYLKYDGRRPEPPYPTEQEAAHSEHVSSGGERAVAGRFANQAISDLGQIYGLLDQGEYDQASEYCRCAAEGYTQDLAALPSSQPEPSGELEALRRERDAIARELGNMRLKEMAHSYANAPLPKIEPQNDSEPDRSGGSEQ